MSGRIVQPIPRLHLIGPLGVVSNDAFVEIAAAAVAGGCDAAHVRLPNGPADDLLELARAMQARMAPSSATLVVNDRLDVALLARAGGVQLGERAIPVGDARRLIGSNRLIGRSVHSVEGARRAEAAGADWLLAGHVFDTPSKAGEPGRGLEWLASVVASTSIPVIALGGITIERLPAVLASGVHGVALGRELLSAPDPEAAARAAREALG